MRKHWPPDRVKEWDDAIEEYFVIEDASKNVNRPNPEEWSTEIPEMLASGFDRECRANDLRGLIRS